MARRVALASLFLWRGLVLCEVSMPSRIFSSVSFAALGAIVSIDPRQGQGWTESIISILLVLAFIATLFFPQSNDGMKDVLVGLLGIVMGAYFNNKGQQYAPPSGG